MFAKAMTYDEKLWYLYTTDLLLIVTLIEEYTGKQIDNSLYIKPSFHFEQMTYEDYWELLEFFMNESGLGSFNSFNEFCEIRLNSFISVHENIEEFSENNKEDILDFFHSWEKRFTNHKFGIGRTYSVDEDVILISAEPGDIFSWFLVCRQLVELDSYCKKQIEVLIK